MNKSEELKNEMSAEENDFKALGLFTKALREKRNENFEQIWLPKLKELYQVEHYPEMGKYIINVSNKKTFHYFPKKNKMLFQQENRWIEKGLNYILNYLIRVK